MLHPHRRSPVISVAPMFARLTSACCCAVPCSCADPSASAQPQLAHQPAGGSRFFAAGERHQS